MKWATGGGGAGHTMALMKRAAGEDMCPLTTARLHKQDNKALNMHSSPFPAQEESQSEPPPSELEPTQ